ncbi:hypothetical protein D3C86_2018010 [compost metagenome]
MPPHQVLDLHGQDLAHRGYDALLQEIGVALAYDLAHGHAVLGRLGSSFPVSMQLRKDQGDGLLFKVPIGFTPGR